MNSYPGMDGFKTGFINASGFNLIASAKRGNQRLIGVVFGGRSWKSRNDHMSEILNTAFAGRAGTSDDIRNASIPNNAGPQIAAKPPTPPPSKPVYEAQVALASGTSTAGTAAPLTGDLNTEAETDEQFYMIQFSDKAPSAGAANTPTAQIAYAPEAQIAMAPHPRPDTDKAVQTVRSAIDNGDYSEVTGQGDYDAITTRRIETGLIAAAVYKGEAEYLKSTQAVTPQNVVLDPPQALAVPPAAASAQTVALHAPAALPPSDLWSVQIGAYTSRVAADDALRRAQSKLPASLAHAGPIVVPLKTGEGVLFRGRLGGLTQAQATEACRHFRDCLPLSPR